MRPSQSLVQQRPGRLKTYHNLPASCSTIQPIVRVGNNRVRIVSRCTYSDDEDDKEKEKFVEGESSDNALSEAKQINASKYLADDIDKSLIEYNLDGLESGSKIIPIFPLEMVALPHQIVPLQIFEARYRVLFNTLISEGDGLIPELIQEDSPFRGTKRFGMCFVDQRGALSSTGTLLEIQKFQVAKDGRLFCVNIGVQRFVIEQTIRETPVLICQVRFIQDHDQSQQEECQELMDTVRSSFRSIMTINGRLAGAELKDEQLSPAELQEADPAKFGFWVTQLVNQNRFQQQILETDSVVQRLRLVNNVLLDQVRYVSAAQSIESAFKSESAPENSGQVKADEGSQPSTPVQTVEFDDAEDVSGTVARLEEQIKGSCLEGGADGPIQEEQGQSIGQQQQQQEQQNKGGEGQAEQQSKGGEGPKGSNEGSDSDTGK